MNSNNKKKKKPKIFSYIFLDFIKITGFIPAMIWKRPKVYYAAEKEKCLTKGGVLIASNHVTFSDPILLYCVFWRRRIHFFATKELYRNKIITFLFNAVGCIPVDKDNFNMGTLHDSVDRLKLGDALLIFPEGQVNQEDNSVQNYKSGAVLMSQLSGAPIQPVYIVKPKKWYSRSIAIVGPPINVKDMCSKFPSVDEIQKVNEYVRKSEIELEQYYINIKKKGERL